MLPFFPPLPPSLPPSAVAALPPALRPAVALVEALMKDRTQKLPGLGMMFNKPVDVVGLG